MVRSKKQGLFHNICFNNVGSLLNKKLLAFILFQKGVLIDKKKGN